MLLRQGDKGDSVKGLQRNLNKLGQMLLVDGNFGPGTCTAIGTARIQLALPGTTLEADDPLQNALTAISDPFPALTAAGVTFIARAEVTDAQTYRAHYQSPCIPPAPSGVTIGIGYDCRFSSAPQFQADWGNLLSSAVIAELATVLGKPGTPDLKAKLAEVVIPLEAAMSVFAKRSLPDYLGRTRSIYPQVDSLPPARQTALVSLVYNRGASLAGNDRIEMRAIAGLLASEQFDDVAAQFDAMTRLWNPVTESGLIARRHSEATLWRSGFTALSLA
jgi:hypothetical protein